MKVHENQLSSAKLMFRSNFIGVLILLWVIGLAVEDGIGTFVHILYAAALAALAVCLGQEVIINRKLRRAFHHCSEPTGRQKNRDAQG